MDKLVFPHQISWIFCVDVPLQPIPGYENGHNEVQMGIPSGYVKIVIENGYL